jgi:hypothetical protein
MTKRQAAQTRRGEVCELFRTLMDGAQTFEDLCDVVNFSKGCVKGWLAAMHESGLVRISDRLPGKCYVYSLQTSPFALPDVPLRTRKRSQKIKVARSLTEEM